INENSSGSVIPVKKEVSAADPSKPATIFFFSGRAVWYIANAAAGKPNIIIGNSPAIKLPAVISTPSFNWAKKIDISPRIISPAEQQQNIHGSSPPKKSPAVISTPSFNWAKKIDISPRIISPAADV